jgi:hypothetical protein
MMDSKNVNNGYLVRWNVYWWLNDIKVWKKYKILYYGESEK